MQELWEEKKRKIKKKKKPHQRQKWAGWDKKVDRPTYLKTNNCLKHFCRT